MKKPEIPRAFCRLCGKHREEVLIEHQFGPIVIAACSQCRVVMHNLDTLLTYTAQKAIELRQKAEAERKEEGTVQ